MLEKASASFSVCDVAARPGSAMAVLSATGAAIARPICGGLRAAVTTLD
jgi:hypothetical protein